MKRIDGDERVAVRLRAVECLIEEARHTLRGGTGADHADRCVEATEKVTRMGMIFASALCDLEAITDVPWTAIMLDPTLKPGAP